MQPIHEQYGDYLITTDKALMKPTDIHHWISESSYWAKGIPYDVFKLSFENSFCIGTIHGDKQIAYGRLITDYATYGYLADVYVHEDHRGKGISKKMIEILFNLDWVLKLRSIALATSDAHELYKKFGFVPFKNPEKYMQILRPNIYLNQS